MLGFIEPGPNVNVPCSKFHDPFPRASARHMGPGAPASAFGTPNAMLARTSQDTAYPWGCPSPVRRSPSGNQPCCYRRCTIPVGHSPTPVPAWSFRTCYANPVFFQRVNWKNSSSIMGHYLLSFVHGPLPAAAVRNIQPSASPPFQNKKPTLRSAFRNFVPSWDEVDLWLPLTSCQLGGKLLGISDVGHPSEMWDKLSHIFACGNNSCQVGTNYHFGST